MQLSFTEVWVGRIVRTAQITAHLMKKNTSVAIHLASSMPYCTQTMEGEYPMLCKNNKHIFWVTLGMLLAKVPVNAMTLFVALGATFVLNEAASISQIHYLMKEKWKCHMPHMPHVKKQIVLAGIHLADIWETPSSRARLYGLHYGILIGEADEARWCSLLIPSDSKCNHSAGSLHLQWHEVSLSFIHTCVCTNTCVSLHVYLCEDLYRYCIS